MQCVFFSFERACCQCFCRDIPISSRGNNITITPPGEGLRCQAKVGLLFWEEKRDAEWWIMILAKPVGCLSSGGVLWVTLVHFSFIINFRWVFQKHILQWLATQISEYFHQYQYVILADKNKSVCNFESLALSRKPLIKTLKWSTLNESSVFNSCYQWKSWMCLK